MKNLLPIVTAVSLIVLPDAQGFSFQERVSAQKSAIPFRGSCHSTANPEHSAILVHRQALHFRTNLSRRMASDSGIENPIDEQRGQDGGKIFDEVSYETDRLAKDAQAMDAMKAIAKQELGKSDKADDKFGENLRSPWKWKLRKRVWDYMEENDIARFPRPVHHRIPNFVGADKAAKNLRDLAEFKSAKMVKVNPDTPQRPVRHFVLQDSKILLTPQPRLRTGFFSTIDMAELPSLVEIEQCTNSKGVVKYGTPITLNEEYTVDLVVVGSTAVCPRTGARVGKGEGFAELEWGILSAQGNLDAANCPVVTTCHDCQVVDDPDDMPEHWELTQHDVPVDIIVTPTRVIRVPNRKPKPSGIFWDLLSPQKLAAIKVLRQLKQETEEKLGATLPSGPDEVLPPVASRNNRKKKKNNTTRNRRRRPNTNQKSSDKSTNNNNN